MRGRIDRWKPRAACLVLLAGLALSGCATTPSPAPGTVSSPIPGRDPQPSEPQSGSASTPVPPPVTTPAPGAAVGTTASGGSITQTRPPTPSDSLPSAEARAVLATIPDPSGSREVVPPAGASAPPAVPTTPAAPDTSEAPAAADTTQAEGDLPIPVETQPLGDRPGTRTPADPGAGSAAPPASPPPSAEAPSAPPAKPVHPDSCWRVQVAAVPEAARADALRDAAQSQLWTAWVIETEKGLHKVRSQGCLPPASAERLKQRAIAAGFAGAFRFKKAK